MFLCFIPFTFYIDIIIIIIIIIILIALQAFIKNKQNADKMAEGSGAHLSDGVHGADGAQGAEHGPVGDLYGLQEELAPPVVTVLAQHPAARK